MLQFSKSPCGTAKTSRQKSSFLYLSMVSQAVQALVISGDFLSIYSYHCSASPILQPAMKIMTWSESEKKAILRSRYLFKHPSQEKKANLTFVIAFTDSIACRVAIAILSSKSLLTIPRFLPRDEDRPKLGLVGSFQWSLVYPP